MGHGGQTRDAVVAGRTQIWGSGRWGGGFHFRSGLVVLQIKMRTFGDFCFYV